MVSSLSLATFFDEKYTIFLAHLPRSFPSFWGFTLHARQTGSGSNYTDLCIKAADEVACAMPFRGVTRFWRNSFDIYKVSYSICLATYCTCLVPIISYGSLYPPTHWSFRLFLFETATVSTSCSIRRYQPTSQPMRAESEQLSTRRQWAGCSRHEHPTELLVALRQLHHARNPRAHHATPPP